MSSDINWTSKWTKGYEGHTSRTFEVNGLSYLVSLNKSSGGWGARITVTKNFQSQTVDSLPAMGNNKREAKEWVTWRAQRISSQEEK